MTDQPTSSSTPAPAPGAAPTFFVVRLTYTAALEEVDAVRDDPAPTCGSRCSGVSSWLPGRRTRARAVSSSPAARGTS